MLQSEHLQAAYNLLNQIFTLDFEREEDVWNLLLQEAVVNLDKKAGTFFAVDAAKETLTPVHSIGVPVDVLEKVEFKFGEGLCGWVARNKGTIQCPDVAHEPRFLDKVDKITGYETKSILCVPALHHRDLLGVIEVVSDKVDDFSYEDRELLEFLTRGAAIVVENLRVSKAMKKVSAHNANILENLSGGFVGVDAKHNILICNSRAKQILGIEVENPIGEPADKILAACPELLRVLVETLQSRVAVKRKDFSWADNGSPKTIGYSTLIFQDVKGKLAGAGVTFQDITKR